jgi:hypothetical protein
MSQSAPWFALSSDWSDSEMFDDSAMGVRLAWVELLAWTKAHGRAGRVRLRNKAFAKQKRLTEEAVNEMLDRASSGPNPAITRQGDEIAILNWKKYQDPKYRGNNDLAENSNSFSKTQENDATEQSHQPPTTKHNSSSPSPTPSKYPSKRVREPKGSGCLKHNRTDITPESLADQRLLRKWFDEECRRADGWVKDSDAIWDNVRAVAAKVLNTESIRDPVAVAKWIIRGNAWSYISATHEDMARAAARDIRSAPADPIVAALANALKLKGDE